MSDCCLAGWRLIFAAKTRSTVPPQPAPADEVPAPPQPAPADEVPAPPQPAAADEVPAGLVLVPFRDSEDVWEDLMATLRAMHNQDRATEIFDLCIEYHHALLNEQVAVFHGLRYLRR